jgi:hypothetical protein
LDDLQKREREIYKTMREREKVDRGRKKERYKEEYKYRNSAGTPISFLINYGRVRDGSKRVV